MVGRPFRVMGIMFLAATILVGLGIACGINTPSPTGPTISIPAVSIPSSPTQLPTGGLQSAPNQNDWDLRSLLGRINSGWIALLIAFVGLVIAILGWNLTNRRKDRNNAKDQFNVIGYEFRDPGFFTAEINEDHRHRLKLAFYQKGVQEEYLPVEVAVALAFPADRELFSEIVDYVDNCVKNGQQFVHVNVSGARKQGKSILLHQLAYYYWLLPKHSILQPRVDILMDGQPSGLRLSWPIFEQYGRYFVKGWSPSFSTRLLRHKSRSWFVVAIDDFDQPVELLDSINLPFLYEARKSELNVIVITTSSLPLPGTDRFELTLTEQDEQNIFHKMKIEHPPVIIPSEVELDDIRGKAGGGAGFTGMTSAPL